MASGVLHSFRHMQAPSFSQCERGEQLAETQVVERVTAAKLLGVIISGDLSWSEHMDFITSTGSQRIYFVCLLRRAGASGDDILCLYKASVRAGLEYACVVWHTSLSTEQSDQIDRLQKRALRIIYPNASYNEALTLLGLEMLHARRKRIEQTSLMRCSLQSTNFTICCRSPVMCVTTSELCVLTNPKD